MTLIDRTERQTYEDVVVQGGGWIIKGLFGWRLCYPLWVFGGRLPLHLTLSRW
ncbi:hypothetical protein HIMB11_02723 [Rhodobacteraceae bacterium HIMB11]|nr:hypothetical protein HIMB11_02723 [Rhodobacteraceae bacterium HIMB11]